MRQRSVNYFLGSLFSKQALYAYGSAAAVTAAGQILLVWIGVFSGAPQRTDALPMVIEIYIETLLPIWIPPITGWNILVFVVNIMLTAWIILFWTLNYERAL